MRPRFSPAKLTLAFALLFPGLLPQTSLAQPDQIQPQAWEQIRALMEEKASWTPVQRKISSRLLLEIKRRRRDALLDALPRLRSSLEVARDGSVLVDIRAKVTPGLLNEIEARGGEVINSHPKFDAVRARLPLDELESLAAASEVRNIRPADRAITRKNNTSDGDVAHAADLARSTFSVTGSGVQLGVLSDGVDSLAARQATGDLPPIVTVLPGQAGSGDEGTAMLEIAFDLAPGSDLFFATALSGQAQFAQNILDLQAAGADVIVDDVFYLAEPVFQDGVIAQAVETVAAAGVVYFSSAGNSGNLNDGTSGVWEGDFVGIPAPPVVGPATVHDFGGGTNNDQITVDPPFAITLHWSDPVGGSGNDYDLFLLDPTLTTIFAFSIDPQTGTQDPFETIDSGLFNDTNNRLVVEQFSGAARYLHLNTIRGRLAIATDGQTSGHATTDNGFGVAAVNVATAAGGTFTGGAANPVELFSSDGPRRVFFEADGTPITPGNFSSTGGALRQKPDIAAADCVSTATPGFSTFCGTSAAAPHAAAIAALMLEADPALNSAGVRTIFNFTALDIEAPGFDRDSGAGIVHAFAAQQIASSRTLTVTKIGDGTGTVTSTQPGIVCGADCAESYLLGTVVEFTAAADASSSFIAWSNACSGAAPTTSVTVDADKTCTAEFGCILGDVDLIVPAQTVSDPQPFTACHSITAGAGAGGFVVAPSGDVTFQAGLTIILQDGFRVDAGGTFRAQIGYP